MRTAPSKVLLWLGELGLDAARFGVQLRQRPLVAVAAGGAHREQTRASRLPFAPWAMRRRGRRRWQALPQPRSEMAMAAAILSRSWEFNSCTILFSSMIAAGVSSQANWVMWTRLFALPHGLPDCPRSLEGGPWRWREIPLENQRPAAYVHSLHVEREVQRIKKTEERPQRLTAAE